MMLLDTHVLIWLDECGPRFGKSTLQRIDAEFGMAESLFPITTVSGKFPC
jgi:hypothetical protein